MYYKFTDDEYAVMLDAMTITRDKIREKGEDTPNLDSAIDKMCQWGSPSGCEFVALTGVEMWLILGANGDKDYNEAKYQAAMAAERKN
jgi:hypothetical protein